MRARLKPTAITSKAQKQALREYAREELARQQEETMRRFFKIMCVSLHEEFQFGRDRLARLLERMTAIIDERMNDEAYWYHVDTVLHQLGIEYQDENYNELDK